MHGPSDVGVLSIVAELRAAAQFDLDIAESSARRAVALESRSLTQPRLETVDVLVSVLLAKPLTLIGNLVGVTDVKPARGSRVSYLPAALFEALFGDIHEHHPHAFLAQRPGGGEAEHPCASGHQGKLSFQ